MNSLLAFTDVDGGQETQVMTHGERKLNEPNVVRKIRVGDPTPALLAISQRGIRVCRR
jgi:hypothetical protein